jgi:hypothetical protein
MAVKDISAERVRELLDYDSDTGAFFWRVANGSRKAGSSAGCYTDTERYPTLGIGNKQYSLHRLAWLYTFGYWPTNAIDHVNRDKHDNRLCNLRDVPTVINLQNVRGQSDHKNVTVRHAVNRSGDPYTYYEVALNVMYKPIYIGRFKTLEAANAAAEEARLKYHPGHVGKVRS